MVLITCLPNVGAQVGAGRMLAGSKFHHPVGNPELPYNEELEWRKALMEKALAALEARVETPTVFENK